MTKQIARRQTAVLSLLLLLLAALNVPRLFMQSFWADECYIIRLIELPFPELMERLSTGDAHPPLHDLLLMGATRLFGTSPAVLQGVSLVAIVGLGILGITWVRRRFGFVSAALYLLLLTFTRSVADYAVEVRMYAWSALLVTLCMACAYELMRSNHFLLWAGLVVTAIGAAYSHYYALVAVGFVFLGLFVYRIGGIVIAAKSSAAAQGDSAEGQAAQKAAKTAMRRKLWLWCAVAGGACLGCLIAYAPWLGTLFSQLRDGLDNWWMQSVPPLQSFLLFPFGWQATGYVLLVLAVAAFMVYFLCAAHVSCRLSLERSESRFVAWDKKALDRDTFFVAWGLCVFVGVLCVGLVVSYLIKPTFLEKYLFPTVGVLLLVLAVALGKLHMGRKALAITVAVIVLTGMLNYVTLWRDEATFDKNTAETKTAMQAEMTPGDYMLSDSDHMTWGVLPYNFPEMQLDTFDWDWSNLDRPVWLCATGEDLVKELAIVLPEQDCTLTEIGSYTMHWYPFVLYRIDPVK